MIVVAPFVQQRVSALLVESEAARQSGDYVLGSSLAMQAVDLATADGQFALTAEALRLYANQQIRLGNVETSVHACDRSVALLRELGDESGECDTLLVKAFALLELGLREEALEALTRSRDIAQRRGDPTQLYWVQNRLGVAYSCIGDYAKAEESMHRALDGAAPIGDEAVFCVLTNMVDIAMHHVPELRKAGKTDLAADKLTFALDLGERALALARQAGNPYRESLAAGNLAFIAGLLGDFDRSARCLHESREIAVAHEYRSLELAALQYEAALLVWQGQFGQAVQVGQRTLELAAAEGEQPVQLAALGVLCDAYEQLGQFALALQSHKEFRALEVQIRSTVAESRARLLGSALDLDRARAEAKTAQSELELHRSRRMELERDVDQLQARARLLDQAAHQDALTGVGNRRHLDNVLPELISAAASGLRSLCIAVVDIDHFKRVNDTFGHAVGDEVLARVAALIVTHSRGGDFVWRMGGEEFLLALIDTDLAAATRVCERIRAAVQDEPWTQRGIRFDVTVSVGVCLFAEQFDARKFVELADAQLYRAKADGRNRIAVRAS